MQFRQLGRQLLEESPTVLTQLSGKLFSVIRMGSPSRFAENTSAKSELLPIIYWGLKLSFRTIDKAKGKY